MSGYIGTQPVPQATQTRDAFTCTAGQTSFATSGYTPSFLDVYLNGIKLAAADYTASNGSDVVLASGAATGDILEVVAYSSFEVVTDTVTKAGTVLNLDRTNSDGTILDLKKDGSTVGSIGSNGGTRLYVESGDVGLRFLDDQDDIRPCSNAGANRDGFIDLGDSASRFKDLYLSGGVYLGGTGSANKLDDYEIGTWTPTANKTISSPTVSYIARNASYVKIGDLVYASFDFNMSSVSGGSGYLTVSGLPFGVSNSSSNFAGYGVAMWRACGAIPAGPAGTQIKGYVERGSSYIAIQYDDSGSNGYGTNGNATTWNTGRVTGYVVYPAAP